MSQKGNADIRRITALLEEMKPGELFILKTLKDRYYDKYGSYYMPVSGRFGQLLRRIPLCQVHKEQRGGHIWRRV
tara:strand:+ start:143 stop:367 length:225 start_codon:yes stop_codon:yes gene_type:complete